jgi:hypothetical protein
VMLQHERREQRPLSLTTNRSLTLTPSASSMTMRSRSSVA